MGVGVVTPKARLYQIYPGGKGLKLVTESVAAHAAEGVPGSVSFFKPNSHVNYRCTLTLPDGTQVVSDLFSRKKDAEHNAAQQALDKMCVPKARSFDVLTIQEKWENIIQRLQETFSDKNVLTYMPLKEHFRVALKSQGPRFGQVPVSVISAIDSKINTFCKVIDRRTESDPVYAMSILCYAAKKCPSITLHAETLSVSRNEPFSADVERQLFDPDQENCSVNSSCLNRKEFGSDLNFVAIRIPSSEDKAVHQTQVGVQKGSYFLDALARKLGLQDGWRLAMSRPLGKNHPCIRLYWAAPAHLPAVHIADSDLPYLMNDAEAQSLEDLRRYSTKYQGGRPDDQRKNVRASLLVGFPVYGDVILAAVGGDWRSSEVYAADISLSFYYRSLLSKFPEGNYKLSRGAMLASDLPLTFTSRLQWRGASPRGLLLDFLQQHRLPDPVFTLSHPGNEPDGQAELAGSERELRMTNGFDEFHSDGFRAIETEDVLGNGHGKNDEESPINVAHCGPFFTTVRVEFQKGSAIDYHSGQHKSRYDAMQSCALKAVHGCRAWFEKSLAGCFEPVLPSGANVNVDERTWTIRHGEVLASGINCLPEACDRELFEDDSVIDSSQIGNSSPPGALVNIRYSVKCLADGYQSEDSLSIDLEKNDNFTFELGCDGVNAGLDQLVANMTVGQIAFIMTSLPATPLVLASSNLAGEDGSLTPGCRQLKYTVQLLRFAEPQEDRMEAALFKPSLSKQRLNCAVSIIHKLQAKSLMDLGCGSGSLMESLLAEETGLEEIVGVDISPKTLLRAAKTLSSKLVGQMPGKDTLKTIKLYEGSIAEHNVCLQGFNVAVCLEVVEHMDPEPLSKFGSTVLGRMQPRVLIVSTPNFEYNPILQGLEWDPSTNSLSELDHAPKSTINGESASTKELASVENKSCLSEGKTEAENHAGINGKNSLPQQAKFRNEDHRFEWTRSEFRQWARALAEEFSYDVTFDGVGGSGEDDGPGFASQIAIFTRIAKSVKNDPANVDDCNGNTAIDSDGQQPINGDIRTSNGHANGSGQPNHNDNYCGKVSDNGGQQKQATTNAPTHLMVWQWTPVTQSPL